MQSRYYDTCSSQLLETNQSEYQLLILPDRTFWRFPLYLQLVTLIFSWCRLFTHLTTLNHNYFQKCSREQADLKTSTFTDQYHDRTPNCGRSSLVRSWHMLIKLQLENDPLSVERRKQLRPTNPWPGLLDQQTHGPDYSQSTRRIYYQTDHVFMFSRDLKSMLRPTSAIPHVLYVIQLG